MQKALKETKKSSFYQTATSSPSQSRTTGLKRPVESNLFMGSSKKNKK